MNKKLRKCTLGNLLITFAENFEETKVCFVVRSVGIEQGSRSSLRSRSFSEERSMTCKTHWRTRALYHMMIMFGKPLTAHPVGLTPTAFESIIRVGFVSGRYAAPVIPNKDKTYVRCSHSILKGNWAVTTNDEPFENRTVLLKPLDSGRLLTYVRHQIGTLA